ncbi:hypothetical protein [Glutamicibacter halophytocola]|uniref:hypothetical protein n=1 Tax=Glutamicibacter halophytocola TaxID=1933880 RepID=UPI0015C549D4|nr:hypothetical protein [Glutamicibacter halophytocola]NQD40503.1 hypothetical protein [Glutamicibacter halophytocola]
MPSELPKPVQVMKHIADFIFADLICGCAKVPSKSCRKRPVNPFHNIIFFRHRVSLSSMALT